MDQAFYSVQDLDEICAELTTARESYANAKIEYETLKDKRSLLIDRITYRIAEDQGTSVAKAKGMVMDDKEFQDFQAGLEYCRKRYEKWRVEKDNLETKWETIRTVLAQNRKERFNQ